MARQLRIQVPGAFYLVSNQTQTRNGLFRSDEERALFMDCLLETCSKTGWTIHALSLTKDGYFILLESPEPNLVDGMKWFQGAFTAKINKIREKREALFERRYRSVIIDPGESDIFKTLSEYVHTAPVWTRTYKGDLQDYEWSSVKDYAASKSRRGGHIHVDRVLAAYGLKDDTSGRKKFLAAVNEVARRVGGNSLPADIADSWKPIRRGWFIGSDKFHKDLQAVIAKTRDGKVPGRTSTRNVHGEAMARNIIKAGLKVMKLKESDLTKMPLGCDEKIALATVLRQKTTISQDWISKRLRMGHRTNVSNGITKVKNDDGGKLTKLVRSIEKASL